MIRMAAVVGIALIGCGGGTPEPKTADSADSAGDAAELATDDTGEPLDEDASNNTGSPEDVQAVIQLVLDDEELNKWLHLTEPGRFPLKIAGEAVAGLELTAVSEPVKIVDRPEDKKAPVLVFTDVEVSADKAYVKVRYDVEGIRASISLEKGERGWEVVNSSVVEH